MGSTGGGGASPQEERRRAPVCVTGAAGYVGSWLVRTLLRRGYHVHATARNPGRAMQLFSGLDGEDRLRVFRADLGEEGSFDEAVRGCAALLHVAASMEFHVPAEQSNLEEYVRSNVLEPAVRGTINVLQACVRAGTVRRVVFTSSISTMTAVDGKKRCRELVDESCVRRVDEVRDAKPAGWIYVLSKRLTEEAAFRFAKEKGISLVSIILPTVAGPFLTPCVPTSIQVILSPITGDPKLYSLLVSVHSRFGCVPLAHIQDICNAHVFLMETEEAQGRYLCSGGSCTMAQLAQALHSQYPSFSPERLSREFHGSNPSVVSSKRLTGLGFRFKYSVREILMDCVAQCADHGFLEGPVNCDC